MGAALPGGGGGGGGGGVAERRLWLLRNTETLLEKIEAVEGEDGESNRPGVESPWPQFTSECQRFGQPPRLDNQPLGPQRPPPWRASASAGRGCSRPR
eukprot:COSAG01_NODE_1416_length_10373_cov_4.944984_3_plen_98_part_00